MFQDAVFRMLIEIICVFLMLTETFGHHIIAKVFIRRTLTFPIRLLILLISWKKVVTIVIVIDITCTLNTEVIPNHSFQTFENLEEIFRLVGSWSTSSSPVRSPSPRESNAGLNYGTTSLQQRSRSPSPSNSKSNHFRGSLELELELELHYLIWM